MTSTIKIKNSSTAGAVPGSGDLVQGELAVNVTDKKIYTKNASGTIVNLGTTPSITDNGNAEAIVIDSSENVGIGVTPSSWSSSYKAFEIAAVGKSLLAAPSSDSVYFSNNAYVRSDGNFAYGRSSQGVALYGQLANSHAWYYAASGTAGNAISFTQAMTLDASGNLLVAGTTANSWTSNGSVTIGSGSGAMGYNANIGTGTGGLYFMTATSGGGRHAGTVGYDGTSNYMWFETSSTERARIDSSGNLLVGTTSAGAMITAKTQTASGSALATLGTSGDTSFQAVLVTKFDNNSTTSQNFIQFQINNGGANCGKITANGANTAAFGSTSDQRVKENIVNLPPQLANIMALRPVEYDYIESYGGGHQIGFIAQEVQQVYPDVISEEDTEEKILSITGWSKTEARLVKAIQEQQAIIESLTARITALEA